MIKYKSGDIVKIVRCKTCPWIVGQIAKIIKSDDPTKYKVEFNQNFVGYFTFTELELFNKEDN